ncbi:alpha/beta hydrolase [Sphingomonas ginsenosidivorax]|uniref:Alpha/beta hydrolase n=1 Tax=Sphingomonas ginsenosidivorax TaxID=862135 RepID=A0A5C6UAP5_9SPHN|nr:alpha/beta hydrolase [Sphingomonas ginsenosidivorax]TXC69842.1 alpha/beta hydrolase [Sphingomonas ginsenosidivorax]
MAFEKVTVRATIAPERVRRAIPGDARVTMWAAPDGWPLRRFDWPAVRPRGRLLFQAGRGDIFEKYLESFAHLHAQGWSVTAFDWRGQGGSGRLSADARVGHASDFGVFDDDLAAFWSAWVAEGDGPTAILGHSMGGMLVMRALANRSIRPDAAILVAPMIGLRAPLGAWFGALVARFKIRTGDPARAAWGSNERPATTSSRKSLLTHDDARYDDERWWQAQHPELKLGPPSWAWLSQAFDGALALAADRRIEAVDTPVLMIVAEADRLVDPHAALRLAARLPDAQVVRFGRESAHEVLREADGVRKRAYAAIDAFLDAHCPR